jgi:hypothetical protein
MRRVALVGLLTVFLLRPSPAAADTLSFDWSTSLGSGNWLSLNLKDGRGFITGWVGEIKWTTSGGKLFESYCADLFDDATIPTQNGTFGTSSDLDAGTFASLHSGPNAGARAAYLVNTYGAAADGNNDLAAGLQIAIWEAMFGGPLTYTATNLWTNSLWQVQQSISSTIMMAANTYYTGLTAANPTVVLASSARYFDTVGSGQDQIGVPEPTTVLLMLFAMVGLLTYQYCLKRGTADASFAVATFVRR